MFVGSYHGSLYMTDEGVQDCLEDIFVGGSWISRSSLYYIGCSEETVKQFDTSQEWRRCFKQWLYDGSHSMPGKSVYRSLLELANYSAVMATVLVVGGSIITGKPTLIPLVLPAVLLVVYGLFSSCLMGELDVRHRERKLKRFYAKGYERVRITEVVKICVLYPLVDSLRRLETPLPGGHVDGIGQGVRKLACGITMTELEQIILDNLPAIRLLVDDFDSGEKLPELERQALIGLFKPHVEKVAARIDADRRQEIADDKQRQAEDQRRQETEYAQAKARRELEKEAALTQAHAVLGWSPKEAAARRELLELEKSDSA